MPSGIGYGMKKMPKKPKSAPKPKPKKGSAAMKAKMAALRAKKGKK